MKQKIKLNLPKQNTGLTGIADVISKTYDTGKEVAKDFMDHLKIKFGESLPKLNYFTMADHSRRKLKVFHLALDRCDISGIKIESLILMMNCQNLKMLPRNSLVRVNYFRRKN